MCIDYIDQVAFDDPVILAKLRKVEYGKMPQF